VPPALGLLHEVTEWWGWAAQCLMTAGSVHFSSQAEAVNRRKASMYNMCWLARRRQIATVCKCLLGRWNETSTFDGHVQQTISLSHEHVSLRAPWLHQDLHVMLPGIRGRVPLGLIAQQAMHSGEIWRLTCC
jgi:hypothetical protein